MNKIEHRVEPRFTTQDSSIMLVDHQSGTINWVKSLPVATVIASCRVLTRMATSYDMPLVLTTTMEEVVGPTIPDIQSIEHLGEVQHKVHMVSAEPLTEAEWQATYGSKGQALNG